MKTGAYKFIFGIEQSSDNIPLFQLGDAFASAPAIGDHVLISICALKTVLNIVVTIAVNILKRQIP